MIRRHMACVYVCYRVERAARLLEDRYRALVTVVRRGEAVRRAKALR